MQESQPKKGSGNAGLVPDPDMLNTNPQAFKKLLMDQVRARGAVNAKNMFQDLVKQTLEAFLELELEVQIGSSKYAPEGRGSGNSRKTCARDVGEVDLDTARSQRRV